jgi:hypothetical protein
MGVFWLFGIAADISPKRGAFSISIIVPWTVYRVWRWENRLWDHKVEKGSRWVFCTTCHEMYF